MPLARRRPELAAHAALLVVGAALRIWFTLEWRPAITGYSDSGIYFQNGVQDLFSDPFRTVGYSMFLEVLHWITPHLLLVTIVQHLMGLATGVLLFATVRRAGGPSWLGLIPAGVVILGGTQLFLEHSALSEALFTLIVAGVLYAAVRGADGDWRWLVGAGVLLGLAVWVRQAGTVLIPALALWLLFAGGIRPSGRALLRAGAVVAAAVVVIGGYMVWRHEETGLSGLTTNGPWNLYGRVAPWASCSEFDAPEGTEALCDPIDPSLRGNRSWEYYIYTADSPAQQRFGPPYLVAADEDAGEKLNDFSIAAIRGQPFDYLQAVWDDSLMLVFPNHDPDTDLDGDELMDFLLGGADRESGRNEFVESWQRLYYPGEETKRSDLDALKAYERVTRFEGPLMALLLVLAAVAPWAVRGEARRGARLFALVGFVLLFGPILGKGYDYRFVVPALGVLAAAAAYGGWGIWLRVSERRAGA